MKNSNHYFSRPEATIDLLREKTVDVRSYFNKKVLLTTEDIIIATPNGQHCFLNCVRLLIRTVKNIYIYLPENQLVLRTVSDLVESINHPNKVEFVNDVNYEKYDAILSVGYTVHNNYPWTTINSNGWMVRLSSGGSNLATDCSVQNPIGSLAAASLGVSEIFKRLVELKSTRGEYFQNFNYSFYSYECTEDSGPQIPKDIPLDILLVGIGAIGNGIIHLLDSLPISGSINIVDKEKYQEENLGTCLLVGSRDLDKPKAQFAYEVLTSKISVNPYAESISDYSLRLGNEIKYPKIVINGLDNIDARREIQRLWPDLIIDGAIGEFACEVSLHPWGKDLSCLLCDYEDQSSIAENMQIRLTGLRKSRINSPEDIIVKDDVSSAPADKQDWLEKRIGQKICSVISEATVKSISTQIQEPKFRPSVPFVACLSSCMTITELIRPMISPIQVLESGFQFDVLIGPEKGIKKAHSRKANCICVQRSKIINSLKQKRSTYIQ